jgi:hypothetical protein
MVRIGLISYSLYLVHWPIVVYFSYWNSGDLVLIHKVILLIITVISAELMYRHVERKYRFKKDPAGSLGHNYVLKAGLMTVAFMLILVASLKATDGWEWRLFAAESPNNHIQAYECRDEQLTDSFERTCEIGADNHGPANALLIGDSHADQLVTAFDYFGKNNKLKIDVWTYPGCLPLWDTYKIYGFNTASVEARCKELVPEWQKLLKVGRYDYVILAGRWMSLYEPVSYDDSEQTRRDYLVDRLKPQKDVGVSRSLFVERLGKTIEVLHANGTKVVVFSQVPLLARNIQDCNRVPPLMYSEQRVKKRCDADISYASMIDRLTFTDDFIRSLESENTLAIIPSDYLCDKLEERCHTLYGNTLMYRDTDHLSRDGSLMLIKAAEERLSRYMNTGG